MEGISSLRLTLPPPAEDAASTITLEDTGEPISISCVFDPLKGRLSKSDLEEFYGRNPTCASCNDLTNRLDKDLEHQPLRRFALTAKNGCKFCALLIRGIVACVPSAERQRAFHLRFRHASFFILADDQSTREMVALDYFIRRGKPCHG